MKDKEKNKSQFEHRGTSEEWRTEHAARPPTPAAMMFVRNLLLLRSCLGRKEKTQGNGITEEACTSE